MTNYKETEERISSIRDRVEDLLEQEIRNSYCNPIFKMQILDPDAREHIIQIGTSIISTREGIGPPGGSFVQAIVDNDLMAAFGRADHINLNSIYFYCKLMYSI